MVEQGQVTFRDKVAATQAEQPASEPKPRLHRIFEYRPVTGQPGDISRMQSQVAYRTSALPGNDPRSLDGTDSNGHQDDQRGIIAFVKRALKQRPLTGQPGDISRMQSRVAYRTSALPGNDPQYHGYPQRQQVHREVGKGSRRI